MFAFSLLLFAAVLIVLAAAAVRGLSDVDQILEIVDTTGTEGPGPGLPVEG